MFSEAVLAIHSKEKGRAELLTIESFVISVTNSTLSEIVAFSLILREYIDF